MPIDKIILSGNQNELKPFFSMAEILYEMFADLENNLPSGSDSDRATVRRSGHPKVTMYFLQDPTKPKQKNNVDGLISFRLMQYNYKNVQTLQKQTLVNIGTKIKEFFGEPVRGEEKEEFKWHKGKNMISYADWDMGYQLQILCDTKANGISVVERILEMNSHAYHPEYVNFIQNNDAALAYPSKPAPKEILGEEIQQNSMRPVATVSLQRAWASIPGMKESVPLYDIRGRNPLALVK